MFEVQTCRKDCHTFQLDLQLVNVNIVCTYNFVLAFLYVFGGELYKCAISKRSVNVLLPFIPFTNSKVIPFDK